MLSSRNLLQAADNVEGYKGAKGMDIVAVEDVDDCCFAALLEIELARMCAWSTNINVYIKMS